MDEVTELEYIEKFLMDIDILDHLDYKLSNFNAFETLGIFNTEIRHSNVLAWLLNPNENHGLGDTFLKKFVQHIFYNFQYTNSDAALTLIDISLMNYNDFIIRREWRDIDVLALSENNKLAVVIENKVWSKESNHQLKKYHSIVHEEFPDYQCVFLYLTPDGDAPSDDVNWLTIDYSLILELLTKSMDLKANSLNKDVYIFLEQYKEVIRRYIVGDEELEKICREIYFKHQKALDIIFEYKPDMYSEIANHLQKRLTDEENLIPDRSGKTYIRFTNNILDNYIPLYGKGWTNTQRILLFELQNKDEKLMLKLIIGPGDQKIRDKIYHITQKNRNVFKQSSKKLTSAYTTIYTREILRKKYTERYESLEEIVGKIDEELNKFLSRDMEKITEILVDSWNTN